MEFFVVANSNAAPFVSDTSDYYVEAESAELALTKAVAEYRHPCGLYAMNVYRCADSYHKGYEPMALWRSERAQGNELPDTAPSQEKREADPLDKRSET